MKITFLIVRDATGRNDGISEQLKADLITEIIRYLTVLTALVNTREELFDLTLSIGFVLFLKLPYN